MGLIARWTWPVGAAAAIVLAWSLPAAVGRYYTQMLALAGIYAIAAHGLNLLAGYAGQASLGHAGFYAIGAYTGALLATKLGIGFWLGLPLSALLAAAAGLLVAFPSFRLEGPYLAMVTIAFGIIVNSILVEWTDVTGGTQGILNIPRPMIAGERLRLEHQLVLIVVALALVTLALRNLLRSPWGRAFVAVRENPMAAESIGLSTRAVKTMAFTISAAVAGLAGHLFAFLQGFISPEAFEFDTSIFFLTIVILGGAGTLAGPLVGAPILTFLPEWLQRFTDYRLIIFGGIIVATLYALPVGIVGTLFRRQTALPEFRAAAPRRAPQPEVTRAAAARTSATAAVELKDVSMVFGGVQALSGVSLVVEPGAVHALIGPNGAGKTVLLNILCGYYPPTSGQIWFQGGPVTGLPAHRLARRGIARTFQTTQMFGELTVLQNVMAAFPGQPRGRLLDSLVATPRLRREEARRREDAHDLLRFVGYRADPDVRTGSLPFGHQRLVEIARALALDPVVLAMDEPAAGLNPGEVDELDDLITRIRDRGIAVFLIEHHMDLVMGISDHVTVLHHGE
ncbi:MAG TPA: branched-chain amino acid ABC transporter ATP-binding protein/permease, partial [Xanthobacteraceae bacterium]|nr:branched-chain amino acid ABC transporter ATP-binding protein/permease [Xanthobacteraceae bacterium]